MQADGPEARRASPNAGEDSGYRTDARWWLPKFKDSRYQVILSVVDRIWTQQSYRRDLHLRHARLYGNLPILGLGPRAYARKALAGTSNRLAFNVIKSCCDAYTAKVTKDRPEVMFLTSGGDWDLQEKAKGLGKFIDGQFYETEVYELAPSIVLDSAVYGNGILHPYIERRDGKERLAVERVFPWEILVDDEEGVYGKPRNFYRRKYIDRVVLEDMFPDHAGEIAIAKREENGVDEWGYDSTADQVLVTECFHLKSGDKAKDGLHIIAISNAILFEEEWEKPYFPYITLRMQPSLIGWWATGLSESLEGIQLELNVLLRKIQRSHHLLAAGHWLMAKGSVNKQKLDNDIGSIIEYVGEKPELAIGMTVSPDVYQHLDRLYQKAYEITGISQLQAQGLKPSGLDSGEAQRVYLDIQTERFQVSLHLYQHFYLELAKQMLDLSREIADRDSSFGVKAFRGQREMEKVVFGENFLEEEQYTLQLYPANALSKDPASRIAEVQEFANAGWTNPREAKRLLKFPDLEEASSMEDASYNLVMDVCADMRKGRFMGPEPFMDLDEAIKVVQLQYLMAKRDRVPEDRLELFRTWLEQASDMRSRAANANPIQPIMPAAPTPGAPPANDNAGAPMMNNGIVAQPPGPPQMVPPAA
jgi:hypothetical protein